MKWGNRSKPCTAIIDSGSDYTCIPASIAGELVLKQVSEVEIRGVGGEWETRPMYCLDLEFLGLVFPNQPVVSTDWNEVLIGRDILNRYTLTLSGPTQEFTID